MATSQVGRLTVHVDVGKAGHAVDFATVGKRIKPQNLHTVGEDEMVVVVRLSASAPRPHTSHTRCRLCGPH